MGRFARLRNGQTDCRGIIIIIRVRRQWEYNNNNSKISQSGARIPKITIKDFENQVYNVRSVRC